jgi:hypothetical protein
MSSSIVVESSLVFVELPIALQHSLSHSSLTLELVGLLVGSSSTALKGLRRIVGVGVWIVLGRITVLSHIVYLLLICR